ncbi:MAG: hypothetical protein COC19_04105 [SAR86 cluster bacterium]|uniref:Uncharacterized protein n=1 Tax=SAR86 cluster bacterium TaxID=2030880 RepID=A0A2A4MNJ7_9GAMM|nr:MAG: hypothetical protein COC19_04105 [SAR86 cluster bacterium]
MEIIKQKSLKLLASACVILLAACVGRQTPAHWPESIPSQVFFQANYLADESNSDDQSQAEYLNWVLSFYQGSLLSPRGWLTLQASVLQALPENRQATLMPKLTDLGASIAAEWAKQNHLRRVDTRHLSLWGSVMQMSLSEAQLLQAVAFIGRDVTALLTGELQGPQVTSQRYKENLGIDVDDGFSDF